MTQEAPALHLCRVRVAGHSVAVRLRLWLPTGSLSELVHAITELFPEWRLERVAIRRATETRMTSDDDLPRQTP